MTPLLSPRSGAPLHADTPHSLADGAERWPVVDGIPFLRVGREAIAASALARLDAGDRDGALLALLADQDDWWRGPTADVDALRRLVRDEATLTLRDAMGLLAWGPVADYFAHRWSDPTFLGGLALVEAHWTAPRRAFELGCGIGHHLRTLVRAGVRVTGADVVFAKLWLGKRFVVPDAELVCFDAGARWPVAALDVDLATCHDAFYFLEPKAEIATALKRLAPDGLVAVSHVHNSARPNHSAGASVTFDALAALFPGALFYDDAEMTRALVEARIPRAGSGPALAHADAFSLVSGPAVAPPRPIGGGVLAMPPDGTALRRNPLYGDDGVIRFPSPRYEAEYGAGATYPLRSDCPREASSGADTAAWLRRRELVDLPERW